MAASLRGGSDHYVPQVFIESSDGTQADELKNKKKQTKKPPAVVCCRNIPDPEANFSDIIPIRPVDESFFVRFDQHFLVKDVDWCIIRNSA